MYMIVYEVCLVCAYIYSSASALEIREQESNLTENSKGRIKYDGWRKMKKWNTHKYLLSYNNNKNEMSKNLDNLNWYKNRFKRFLILLNVLF